jgi:hypothetical protein
MDNIPFDAILTIALIAPRSWYVLVQCFKQLAEYGVKYRDIVIDYFTRKIVDSGTTVYLLPNGVIHRTGNRPSLIITKGSLINSKLVELNIMEDFLPVTSEYALNRIHMYLNISGKLHREGDKPAVIYTGVYNIWFKDGKIHRDGGQPAIIEFTGQRKKSWWLNGNLWRAGDKPTIVSPTGRSWHKNNHLHRGRDKPAVITMDGTRKWIQNGKMHRDGDRPAIIHKNNSEYIKIWMQNGIINRNNDLPAVCHSTEGSYKYIWYKDNLQHRDNYKVANIYTYIQTINKNGIPKVIRVCYRDYYNYGELYNSTIVVQ